MPFLEFSGKNKQNALALKDAISEYSDICIKYGFDSKQVNECRNRHAELPEFLQLARTLDRHFMRIAAAHERGASR